MSLPKIVVIGGGTGSFALLRGLRDMPVEVTAVCNMADDGGSSGILRDELNVLPPGDVRQCLTALAEPSKLRDALGYRFDNGVMRGHALGNILLAALQKSLGNLENAITEASRILQVRGTIAPVTFTDVRLCINSGGTVHHGQSLTADMQLAGKPEIWLEPDAVLNPAAERAIHEADLIVVSPGRLYGSLSPALVVPGLGEALRSAKARKVYVCNLETKPGQTDNYSVADHAAEIERMAGGPFLDVVLYNTATPNQSLLDIYAQEGMFGVRANEQELANARYQAIGLDLLCDTAWDGAQGSDPLAKFRTFIRHDPTKTAHAIIDTITPK